MEPLQRPEPPTFVESFQYIWRSPWVQVLCYVTLFVLLYILLGSISNIVIDFSIAFLVAYLFNPLLTWLNNSRLKVSRNIGVLLVVFLLLSLITLMGVLITTISSELIALIQRLPTQINNLGKILADFMNGLAARGFPSLDNVEQDLTNAAIQYVNNLSKNIIPILQNSFSSTGTLFSGLASIGGYVARFLLIILMSIYLMLDYSRVNEAVMLGFPKDWRHNIEEIVELIDRAVGGYVRGQLIIASFIGIVVWIGLSFVGIPNAAAIGFLAGSFNIVPYLGPIVGATPALLLALTLPAAGLKMLLVVVVFAVANQIEGQFLSPMVLSKTTDLHPLSVLLSILVGVSLFGMVGALLAVPTVALAKLALHKYYYSSNFYKGRQAQAVSMQLANATSDTESAASTVTSVTDISTSISPPNDQETR